MHREVCKELPWDSEFFGVRVAQYLGQTLTEASRAAALAFCRERQIDCLYLLLADGPVTEAAARSCSFQHVDTRLTLERTLADLTVCGETPRIRTAEPGDLKVLREIARISHRDSRFYSDPNFERSRCDALYEKWIERSVDGWADRTLVAVAGGRPSGYITCHLSEGKVGSIGLFAVAEDARGKGLGKQLIAAALAYFHDCSMDTARVVTQLRNVAARQIYERCGFTLQSAQSWFHAWPRKAGAKGGA
jgi:dTDP-4-amino-4,6-dideoxy-D-galactose acyltransferase